MPKTMDPATADRMFGEIVHVTDHMVLRCREHTGQTQVIAHRRGSGGEELLPHGYSIGTNTMYFTHRADVPSNSAHVRAD